MRKFLRKLPMILIALAVIGGLVYAFWPAPVPVDLAPVTRGPMRLTVDEDGKTRIKIDHRYVVSAPLAGLYIPEYQEVGATVASDKPLAVLKPTDPALLDPRARAEARANVDAAEAAIKQAKADLSRVRVAESFARSEYERLRRLVPAGTGGISRQELDDAAMKLRTTEEQVRAAEFAVRVAEHKLKLAEAALTFTNPASPGEAEKWRLPIPPPLPGAKVLQVFEKFERVVPAGTKLVEIGDPQRLEAEIDLLTIDAVKVREGAKVLLEHWGGEEPLKGNVRLIEKAGFTKISALGVEEQRVNAIVDFVVPPEYQGAIGDGYRVEARIIIWEADDVLKVPSGALFRSADGKGWAVFVESGGRAVPRPVKVGHNNGLEAEILKGLEEGERVVLHPSDKITDGVTIVERNGS